jgi:hypothetical protein
MFEIVVRFSGGIIDFLSSPDVYIEAGANLISHPRGNLGFQSEFKAAGA